MATKLKAACCFLGAKAAKPKAARPSSAEGAKKRPASAEGSKRKSIKLEEKPAAAGSGAKGAAGEKKVRVKKEYELPGQTREPPDETDPLRRFYTSLLEQRPESEMSKKWLVQHGLLPEDEAQAYVDSTKAAKGSPPAKRKATPTKAPAKRPSSAGKKEKAAKAAPAKRKRKEESESEDSDDDDFDEKPALKKRAPAVRPSSAGNTGKAKAGPQLKKAKGQDRAFEDDDESDSEDDKPLAMRKA
eukprot:jgi/Astpho2/7959/Aster-06556